MEVKQKKRMQKREATTHGWCEKKGLTGLDQSFICCLTVFICFCLFFKYFPVTISPTRASV